MTSRTFIFLLIVTVVAVTIGEKIASTYVPRGIERTIAVAVITALIVFPVARLAEKRGWIKGAFNFGRRTEVDDKSNTDKRSDSDRNPQ